MTGATIRSVNRAIARAKIPVELVRAPEGYHYFIYDNPERGVYDTVSVMVPYTNSVSVERWVQWAEEAYVDIIETWNQTVVD